jgi:hypothetical protein
MSKLLGTVEGVSGREVVLALAFVVVALSETFVRGLQPSMPLLILAVLMPLSLVWRIRFPLEVLAACVAVLMIGELVAH